MIEMFDPRDSKSYDVEDLRIVYHEIPDKRGKLRTVKCVEYTVIGKSMSWPFWMTFDAFTKANPDIEIGGLEHGN